jgi:KUP system potassium uptake protein
MMSSSLDDQKTACEQSGGDENTRRSSGTHLPKLTITALGIVFGDIGTSPLYALRECFHGEYGIAVSSENVLGVLSLMFWSLIMIVTIKYLVFVLRADNNGEGGVLALTALLKRTRPNKNGRWFGLIAMAYLALACYTGTA